MACLAVSERLDAEAAFEVVLGELQQFPARDLARAERVGVPAAPCSASVLAYRGGCTGGCTGAAEAVLVPCTALGVRIPVPIRCNSTAVGAQVYPGIR